MKQKWIRPQTTIEKFVPDEYIAACWGVACDRWQSDPIEGKGVEHRVDHCGNLKNQVIYDHNSDGIPDEMIEEGTDGLGNLYCTIEGGISNVRIGDYISWKTTSGNRTWHHYGRVIAEFPDRPNHS